MSKLTKLLVVYVLFVVIALFYIELAAPLPYFAKVAAKISLMLAPALFIDANFFLRFDKKKLRLALWLGLASFLVIQATYLALESFIDLEQIRGRLLEQQRIDRSIFIWVAIYTTFGNSFLEEWFFRGFIANLPLQHPWFFSSLLFSIYHLTIFISWFSWRVVLIVLVGLLIGGLFFCWLNDGRKSIWNSWVMHVCADISIMIIGLQMYDYL